MMNVFTWAAAVIGVTVVSAAVEAVVMIRVTHLVISVTVGRDVTHLHLAEAVVTNLPVLAVRVPHEQAVDDDSDQDLDNHLDTEGGHSQKPCPHVKMVPEDDYH